MTLAELSKKYGVHPTQIGTWKRAAIENMATAFTRRSSAPEQVSAAGVDKLHSKIGQLVMERDFLAPSRQIAAQSPAGQWKPRINCSGRASLVTLPMKRHCRSREQKMVSRDHRLSLRKQCELLQLLRYNWITGELNDVLGESEQNLFDGVFVRLLLRDKAQNIWVGTHSGVYRLDPDLKITLHIDTETGQQSLLPPGSIMTRKITCSFTWIPHFPANASTITATVI